MANENDDVLKANQGAHEADIPNLKKKEKKEKKKAGAAWSGGQGAGEFAGATGGNGARAAASAASAAGGAMGEGAGMLGAEAAAQAAAEAAAAEGGGIFAGISRFLAGIAESLGMGEVWAAASEFMATLTSTVLGKVIVAAAAMLMAAVVGLIGYALLKGGADGSMAMPDLGGITDNMKIRGSGADRLGVASNGELNFGSGKTNAPAKTEAKAADESKADDKKAPADKGDGSGDAAGAGMPPADRLAHNLSGAKLSSSLGGDFGNKNIFAGGNTPKFDLSKTGMPHLPAISKGKLGQKLASGRRASATARTVGRAKSSRAIGQLKMAKGMSMIGADAANAGNAENAAEAANGAFDQQQSGNGTLNTNTGVVTPPDSHTGGGSGGNTNLGGGPGTNDNLNLNSNFDPGPAPGSIQDPNIKNATDQISQMAAAARQMQQMGMMLLALGAVIIGIGIKICSMPFPGAGIIGAAIIAAGVGIMGVGYMMMQMSQQMAAMAKAMGSALAASMGGDNPALKTAVNSCTDQALANGTTFDQCTPSNDSTAKSHYDNMNTVGSATTNAELNSNVTVNPITTH
ncbi:MAG: hypothetical protein KGJ84_05095 [Elusimicrobia bacterium]|nr:hypothetical protein [Elusimicrobiota bacterium]